MVFLCLDGAFRSVAEMVVRGHRLKCNVVLAKIRFEVIGALVTNDVKGGHVAIFL